MAKAEELEKEGKFREAWMKVLEITEVSGDEIRKRKNALSEEVCNTEPLGGQWKVKPELQ
jgi:hypothetical protein